ncbi:MAG: pyridoxamine 5'-phosphate oxidase family protein [Litorimonas sp.]
MEDTPWHSGESHIHEALQIIDKMKDLGQRMIRDYMPDQHREFFSELDFVILSALDQSGRVWPFIWSGEVGFMSSPDPKYLIIKKGPLSGQPEGLLLQTGDKVSVLGIVPETKRRNRMNGTITKADDTMVEVKVDQSYGNCPRYIHVRERGNNNKAGSVEDRESLSVEDKTLIAAADTLFIATRVRSIKSDPRKGVDVNHRGGPAGFITLRDDNSIVIPDYAGNNFFNAYGNILNDPRIGLLIPNLETGDILTLNGRAEVVLEDYAGTELYGSHRYLIFSPDKIRRANTAFPFVYALTEYSASPPHPGKPNR